MSRLVLDTNVLVSAFLSPRGNRREAIFFEDDDQAIDCNLLAEQSVKRASRSGPTA